MKTWLRALVSFVAAMAVALPVAVITTGAPAGASSVTYTATQSFTPPSSNFTGTSGGGDGWGIATYNGRVYNVFHHQTYFGLMCHNQNNASACWTTTDTGTTGTTNVLYKTITVNGQSYGTPAKVGLYVDQATGFLYVYAVQISNLQPGVICVNLNAPDTTTDPTCSGSGGQPPAWTPLAAAGQTGWSTSNPFTGTVSPMFYNGNLYAWNPVSGHTASTGGAGSTGAGDNTVLCYDIATQSACANEPYAVTVSTSPSATNTDASPAPPTTLVGSDLFIPTNWSTGGVLACVNLGLSVPGNCAGSWPTSISLSSSNAMSAPSLDSSGNPTGICGLNSSSAWLCWGLDGSVQPTPTGLTSSVLTAWQWAGTPVVVGTRVFEISGPGGSNPGSVYCYDFATNAACTTSTGHFPVTMVNNNSTYTVTPDSQRPTCLWINGDNGSAQIQTIDALTGGSCANAPVRVFASSFVEPYQACVPTSFNTLTLTQGNIATSPAPTLSFTNGNGVVIDGPYAFNTTGSQPTIDLTSLAYPTPINLSTQSALPQFVLNLTPSGTSGLGTVTVQVSWSGTQLTQCGPGYSGPAPATAVASAITNTSAQFNGSINNSSTDTVGPVTFCYQTTNFSSGQCNGTTVTATAGSVSATVTPYSAAVTTLAPSTTYYYELVATDATQNAPLYGGVQQFTTGPVATTGPVSNLTNTSATATGSLYNPANDSFTSVQFCYQTTSFVSGQCTGTTTTATAGSTSPSGTTYSLGLSSLTPGTTYYYELVANDGTTSTTLNGGVQHFTAAPVSLTSAASVVGDTTATIDGTVYNPNGDSLGASFCYATTAFTTGNCAITTGHVIVSATAGSTVASTTPYSAALTGLTPGTTYYYELLVADSTTTSNYVGGVKTLSTGPTALTSAALNIEPTSTTLAGSLYNPAHDVFTSVQFCYQPTAFTSGNCTGSTGTASAGTTSGSTTQYTLAASSLVPGTTYYYELVATDPVLTPSVYVGGVRSVTVGPVTTTSAVSSPSSSSATLTGSVNNPNSMGLASVQFCYQATSFVSGSCAGTVVSAVPGTTSGSTTTYTANVSGLSPLTNYYDEMIVTPTGVGGPFDGGVVSFQTAGVAPTISTATISGTPTVGQTLSAVSAGVTGTPTPSESYQWLRDGQPIPGATSATYVVQASDYSHALSVTITETNSVGHASATSTPSSSVAGQQGVPPSVSPPQITVSGISPSGVGAVTWTPAQVAGGVVVTGYTLQYSSNGGKSWVNVPASDISGTSATLPGLSSGGNYLFRVVAKSSLGTTPVSGDAHPTKLTRGPLTFPSRPFAAYRANFSVSSSDLRAIEMTLKQLALLHLHHLTITGYAIYETRAHDGRGRYLTLPQVQALAKARAISAEEYLVALDLKLRLAPIQITIAVKVIDGKSHLTNFELYRRVTVGL